MKTNNYMPAVGDFFTVTKWVSHPDRSYVGDCLECRVVDGPLMRVRRHHSQTHKDNFTLNAEDIEMRKLSPAFVADHTEQSA